MRSAGLHYNLGMVCWSAAAGEAWQELGGGTRGCPAPQQQPLDVACLTATETSQARNQAGQVQPASTVRLLNSIGHAARASPVLGTCREVLQALLKGVDRHFFQACNVHALLAVFSNGLRTHKAHTWSQAQQHLSAALPQPEVSALHNQEHRLPLLLHRALLPDQQSQMIKGWQGALGLSQILRRVLLTGQRKACAQLTHTYSC